MYRRILIGLGLVFAFTTVYGQMDQDYRNIDRHARRAPEELQRNLPALVDYLSEHAADETEQVRAFFYWIAQNITYDTDAFRNGRRRINRNIGDILRRRRAVCTGYAQLVQAMCRQASISCEIIEGYSKGTLTTLPDLRKPDHAWNAVFLDGQWRLLDATWGSSVLQSANDFVQIESEAYFLSSPERFILTHLPVIPQWQLLQCPVSPERFRGPADQIIASLAECNESFAYPDSIQQWRALPRARQRLSEAEGRYRFNPTPPNRNNLGHAYMDYAGELSDSTEALQAPEELDRRQIIQERIIGLCEKALLLTDTLYRWQKELFVNNLMNQAVVHYQKAVSAEEQEAEQTAYKQAQLLLRRALQIIGSLSGESIYAKQMERRCREYLEILESYVEDQRE